MGEDLFCRRIADDLEPRALEQAERPAPQVRAGPPVAGGVDRVALEDRHAVLGRPADRRLEQSTGDAATPGSSGDHEADHRPDRLVVQRGQQPGGARAGRSPYAVRS